MNDVESVLGVSGGDPFRFRESLLSRIASYRIENPKAPIEFSVVFYDHLQKIRDHYYQQQAKIVQDNLKAIAALDTDHERSFSEKQSASARKTISELERRFGYDRVSALACVKFLMTHER
jgi:hypothetical protein